METLLKLLRPLPGVSFAFLDGLRVWALAQNASTAWIMHDTRVLPGNSELDRTPPLRQEDATLTKCKAWDSPQEKGPTEDDDPSRHS